MKQTGLKALTCTTAWIVLAASAGFATAKESIVSILVDGQSVVGTLEIPDDALAPAPVVLMLHGFTGTRNELPVKDTDDGVFTRAARELLKNGYASLRIDFRGSGDSDGKWEETTFTGQIKDAVAAIDWLRDNPDVEGSDISVLGWSQGGLVASHAVAARPEVTSTILWAPVTNPMLTYSNLLGAETVMNAIAGDAETPHTVKLPWGVETTLKGAFYQQLPTTSTAAAIAAYPGPLMVIVGSRDTTVTPQPAAGQILTDYHPGKEQLVIFDTDHVWDAFSGPATLDDKMIPTTLKWLRENAR
ncbi:MAG: alpha/beta fold hydrolase [Hyphomicrobiales bacterium]|nr:alpha/beta fold hydrolase [Hyphomicrobiales bacterium]MCP4999241.1 alpha/beta fold hydrolase [Hyphomicrobiales bacterium]